MCTNRSNNIVRAAILYCLKYSSRVAIRYEQVRFAHQNNAFVILLSYIAVAY